VDIQEAQRSRQAQDQSQGGARQRKRSGKIERAQDMLMETGGRNSDGLVSIMPFSLKSALL
jgi:hypothetical protein